MCSRCHSKLEAKLRSVLGLLQLGLVPFDLLLDYLMGLALLQQGDSWVIPSFAISLISEAMKKGTGKDWNKELTSQKPREVQLGQDQMEGPNDTESAGLSQRRKLSRLQKDCTDQGWVTPGTDNSIHSEAGRYKNGLLAHITAQCYQ